MPHDTDVLPDTDNGAVTSTSEARNAGTSHLTKAPSSGSTDVPPEAEAESTTTGALTEGRCGVWVKA